MYSLQAKNMHYPVCFKCVSRQRINCFFYFALGHIKLVDFGLSKLVKLGQRTGTICGTLQYMGKIEIHYTLNETFFKNLRIFEAEDFTCTKFQNVTFTLPEFAFGNPLIQTPWFFFLCFRPKTLKVRILRKP